MVFPGHAFLKETLTEFLFSAIASESWFTSFTSGDTDSVVIIVHLVIHFRVITMRGGWHNACHASLYATISVLLHRVLTCRQGLDGGNDNFVHGIILTAESCCRDTCQLFLIVQGLFATPVQDITIRFC